jgi:hypothetical protein
MHTKRNHLVGTIPANSRLARIATSDAESQSCVRVLYRRVGCLLLLSNIPVRRYLAHHLMEATALPRGGFLSSLPPSPPRCPSPLWGEGGRRSDEVCFGRVSRFVPQTTYLGSRVTEGRVRDVLGSWCFRRSGTAKVQLQFSTCNLLPLQAASPDAASSRIVEQTLRVGCPRP